MNYQKKIKYTPEYVTEVKAAVKYFYDNHGNIPMREVHNKFFHVTYSDIDNAIMEECHRRALEEKKENGIIPPEFDAEVSLLIE